MEEFVYYNDLFDIYKFTITETNQKIFEYYYAENLSMQEIADILHVSKSFIGASIKKTIKKLDNMEQNLHIYENKNTLKQLLDINDLKEIKSKIEKIIV